MGRRERGGGGKSERAGRRSVRGQRERKGEKRGEKGGEKENDGARLCLTLLPSPLSSQPKINQRARTANQTIQWRARTKLARATRGRGREEQAPWPRRLLPRFLSPPCSSPPLFPAVQRGFSTPALPTAVAMGRMAQRGAGVVAAAEWGQRPGRRRGSGGAEARRGTCARRHGGGEGAAALCRAPFFVFFLRAAAGGVGGACGRQWRGRRRR